MTDDDVKPTEDRKELARRLLVERAVVDELAARLAVTDKEARDRYRSGDADTVETEEETDLGKVSRDRATMVAEVEAGEDFDAFVKINHPEHWEVVTHQQATPAGMAYLEERAGEVGITSAEAAGWITEVVDSERVAPAYVQAIEAKVAKARGDWTEEWTDPATGEVRKVRPSWLRFRKKAGAFRVMPSPELRRMVRERFHLDTLFAAATQAELPRISPMGEDEARRMEQG